MRFLIKMVGGGLDGGVDGGTGVGGWAGANVMEGNAAVNCAEQ